MKQPATAPVTLRVNNVDIPLRQTGTLTYLEANMTWTPMDNRNTTITRPNLTDISTPSVTVQHQSTAKFTYYNMPSSPD